MARFMHAVHISALGIWLGALLMAGATAAIIFPLSRSLDLQLPAYSGYTGEHWRLGAGIIQSRVFTALDFVQLVACTLAIVTLGHALFSRRAPGKIPSIIRVVSLLLLLLSLIGQFFFMHLPMDTALLSYWEAARAGDNALAADKLAAFEKFHGTATALMAFDTVAVLVALALGAWAGISGLPGKRA